MLILISNIFILRFATILFLRTNPLSIGILILMMALSSTFTVSLIISWWLCFLIFLIYVRGMLILFSYFVAITPNIPSSALTINIFSLLIITTILISLFILPLNRPIITIKEYYSSFFYTDPNNFILIVIILLLLLTIIIVVKLIAFNYGPLRPFYNIYV